jgi:phage-related tail fiber protein
MLVGMIMPYGAPVTGESRAQLEQQGWLPCDGAAIPRELFPELFATIGGSWGQGDNVTTFNVPDLRGYFMRGVDHGAGHDPDAAGRGSLPGQGNRGDNVGSYQADAVPSRTSAAGAPGAGATGSGAAGGQPLVPGAPDQSGNGAAGDVGEARPKNVYVEFLICYTFGVTHRPGAVP